MGRRNHNVITAILGGGRGTRLYPLTRDRSKPAVPLGGRFRLIDIPLSNSLHAGFDKIYVLTQFNTASLHRHITRTYRFDTFSQGFVNILAAEQTLSNETWYQGTADAVRQNMERLAESRPSEILVLAGDHLYLMNLGRFLRFHREHEADVSIAVQPVAREMAGELGIMRVDGDGRIVDFVEKPHDPAQLDELTPSPESFQKLGLQAEPGSLLASMGIYTFATGVLAHLLENDPRATDFGREIIPQAIESHRVFGFPYSGYWEDIGTIPAFHRANLQLTGPVPPLNLYDANRPIFTRPRFLPGSKIQNCSVRQAVLCAGSLLEGSVIEHSIVGIRSVIRENSIIADSVIMGAREFENGEEPIDGVRMGVGPGCEIRNAIIDLDARIGAGSRLVNEAEVQNLETETYSIRDGIIVVPKGAVIPAGTEI
jgi:glucose-1-phosphate adenylyltransferase